MTGVQAWWRFHGLPGWISFGQAAAARPGLFAVAGFLLLFWAVLALAGMPLLRLPASAETGAFLLLTLAGALSALAAVRRTSTLREAFFGPGRRPQRQRRLVGAARAALCWAGAVLAAACLSGPGWGTWLAALAAGPLFAAAFGPLTFAGKARTGLPVWRRNWPGPVAWCASQPAVYLLPFAGWALVLAWMASGGAGLVWNDRPPAVGLFLAFGWPLAVALGTSGLGQRLPYRFFRAARAPFRRVMAVTAGPVAFPTLAAALAGVLLSSGTGGAVTAAALSVTGAALWLFFGLRFPSGSPALLAVQGTVFVTGAVLLPTAGLLWALVQGAGALVLAAGWRTLYLEGETDADR